MDKVVTYTQRMDQKTCRDRPENTAPRDRLKRRLKQQAIRFFDYDNADVGDHGISGFDL
jgi:hypothetical protein